MRTGLLFWVNHRFYIPYAPKLLAAVASSSIPDGVIYIYMYTYLLSYHFFDQLFIQIAEMLSLRHFASQVDV